MDKKRKFLVQLIEKLKNQISDQEIAIIGVTGRYPQANTLEAFWNNLKNGTNCISEIPADRWNWQEHYDQNGRDSQISQIYSKWGGFIADVDKFDSLFFNISPLYAQATDPQERLFLETVWALFEDAGYTRQTLAKLNHQVGTFVGVMNNNYEWLGGEATAKGHLTAARSAYWSIANRVSYFFDFTGPSLAIDTACSSSLTAIHLACDSLKKGECQIAIAGGVNLILHPMHYYRLCYQKMLASDDRCKSFGEGADGFVDGEGIGAILLKPLQQAIKDKDTIYGVIKGSSINAGGKTSGYTVPNPNAQTDLIVTALNKAQIDPRTISYVEAHGTGTSLGDPIEIAGLMKAYKTKTKETQYCSIGSVKSNIGHLESAAGIAALTKVLLQMKYQQLVPSLHSERLNPNINFKESPFYVQQTLTEWKQPVIKTNGEPKRYPRLAAISSFGAGGANAHLIVEEYEPPVGEAEIAPQGDQLIVLSAKNEARLQAYAKNIIDFLNPVPATEMTSESVEVRQPFQQDLLKVASEILKVSDNEIDLDDDLSELGFDTVSLTELSQKLNDKYFVSITPAIFSDKISLGNVAQYLSDNYQAQTRLKESTFTNKRQANLSLAELAYTLQVGREAMEERLAMVVDSLDELREKLTQYAQGQTEIDGFYRGNVKTSKAQSELLIEGEDGRDFLKSIVKNRKLTKLAQLWVSGTEIDWQLLYPSHKPQRISLPTYPFARERYWVPATNDHTFVGIKGLTVLHSLLDSNESTLEEQCFKKLFQRDEFYLKDHLLDNHSVLPGVISLEMARSAGELAIKNVPVNKLTNIVWAQSITIAETPRAVSISLYPTSQQQVVEFEVSTFEEPKQVHAQGKLTYGSQTVSETVDIEGIQNRCLSTWNGAECYKLFKTTGLNYGPSFQTIQALYHNDSEALSRLQLPPTLKNDFNDFVLHPSLMDGALQTVIGLMGQTTTTPYIPFALGSVELLGPLSGQCYAYVCRANNAQSAVKKFNISIMDDAGNVSVRLKDFSVRALKQEAEMPVTMYYQSVWEPSILEDKTGTFTSTGTVLLFDMDDNRHSNFKERLKSEVILVTPGENYQKLGPQTYSINPQNEADYRQMLAALSLEPSHIIHMWSQAPFVNDKINAQLEIGLFSIFYLSQALLTQKPQNPIQLLYIYIETPEALQPQYAALSGFAKTIRLENSKLNYKTVALANLDNVVEIALTEFQTPDIEIRYEKGQRWIKHLQEFDGVLEPTPKLKENGVYLITGGAGDLGLIFAEYLAKNFKAKLVLTGRSELNKEKKDKIQELNLLGANVIYHQADISKRDDVVNLIAQTKSRFNEINGIIHSAGVAKDALVIKKTTEEMAAVLASKVYGTVYLDEATQNEQLDFMVLFSSVAAVLGNVGQCDYAYANGFMDNFALWRSAQKRFGKTLSINWPLWQSGGIQVLEQTEKWLANTMGIQPLSTETGLEAFNQGLGYEKSQFIVLEGERSKVRKGLGIEAAVQSATMGSKAPAENRQLLAKFQPDILSLAGSILKVSAKDIDPNDDISEYGFDSISFTELANQINDKYQIEVTPTIFFEYPSVSAFSQFLCDKYFERLLDYYSDSLKVVSTTSPFTTAVAEVKLKSRFIEPVTAPHGPSTHTPIAIIGMSGVMPQSKDLESFWQHLATGDDLIQEIPKERWDWKAFYGEGPNQTLAKWGGFMDEVDQFDALFFGISPKEARFMDPQQRLFLQTALEAIENAGIRPSSLSGSQTGLFVGVTHTDYLDLIKTHAPQVEPDVATGLNHTFLANRISYRLNLYGPSEPINTACSSSLVAIHRAVNAIHHGECEMAIAGGVQIILDPMATLALSKGGMLSKDGRCKTFDKSANGYVRGEGVGAILLKPLSQAQADGNPIYAVIRGTAENHGGHAKSLTSPNPNAQANLLIKAYEKANISPETVSYIEAHGTGTSLGDPIEINGLKKAFAALYQKWGLDTIKTPHCGLGSVKSNIGHLESAAGIAGVLKVLLMMQHKTLPATLHLKELNPYIELQDSPFYMVDSQRAWEQLSDEHGQTIPRRAGVSSFGFGGSNAHVVLEEYPQLAMDTSSGPQIIVLSAKNADILTAYAKKLATFLKQPSPLALANIAWTLQTGREAMEERLALVVDSLEQLTEKLAQFIQPHQAIEGLYQANIKKEKNRTHLLLEGEAGKAYVDIIMQTRDFAKLANLWVTGIDIDWSLLYPNGTPNLVPLPTYPFAKKRYWISDVSQRQTDQQTLVAKPKPVSVKTPAKPETLPPARIDKNDAIHVLLLSSNRALAEHLQREIDLIRVEPGNHFQQMIQNQPTQIIYYLSETDDAIETQLQPLDYLKKAEPKQFIQLLTVIPTESSDQLREAFQDYGKTLQQNNPQFLYKTVMTETQQDSEWLAKMLKKELQLATLQDCDVRYQDGQRQVKSYHSLGNPYQLMQMLKF